MICGQSLGLNVFIWRAVTNCGELTGQFWFILSHQTCNWEMVLLTGMPLYRDATTGSQEVRREFKRMVLKFLLVISASRALAWESLFCIIVIWFLLRPNNSGYNLSLKA